MFFLFHLVSTLIIPLRLEGLYNHLVFYTDSFLVPVNRSSSYPDILTSTLYTPSDGIQRIRGRGYYTKHHSSRHQTLWTRGFWAKNEKPQGS